MKNVIKLIIFIIYTISIFFINNFAFLGILFLLNCVIAIISKIDLKRMICNFRIILPFIIFTIFINILLDGLYDGVIIGVKIFNCYIATYIFSKVLTISEIADTIQKLCYPLKIFKINTNNIGIIVSISICMIPVLKREMYALIQAMKSKGKSIKINNIIIIMKSIFISILIRSCQIERTLISKAYREE